MARDKMTTPLFCIPFRAQLQWLLVAWIATLLVHCVVWRVKCDFIIQMIFQQECILYIGTLEWGDCGRTLFYMRIECRGQQRRNSGGGKALIISESDRMEI